MYRFIARYLPIMSDVFLTICQTLLSWMFTFAGLNLQYICCMCIYWFKQQYFVNFERKIYIHHDRATHISSIYCSIHVCLLVI